jgi:hypothetical protein
MLHIKRHALISCAEGWRWMADSLTSSTVFIGYSHRDKDYLDRLQEHLKPEVHAGTISLFDDTKIKPGDNWKKEIKQALESTQVAILLVSVSFLASDFVVEEELPKLLAAAEERGTRILPVILTPCSFHRTKLSRFQAINDPTKPLSGSSQHGQDIIWVQVVDAVLEALEKVSPPQVLPAPPTPPLRKNLLHPPATPPKGEPLHQQRALEALPPIAEPIPIEKPNTGPGHRTWWVVVACPKDGDVEDPWTWRVVYASPNNTSTWDEILPHAQPYWQGAKAVRGFTRHAATKNNWSVNYGLRYYFDALHWEHPFAVDWLKEFEAHEWPDPREEEREKHRPKR